MTLEAWQSLVDHQARTIDLLIATDFTSMEPEELSVIVEVIENGVRIGGLLLGNESTWKLPMREFDRQLQHLDSIAESLRLGSDPEAMRRLAVALATVRRDR